MNLEQSRAEQSRGEESRAVESRAEKIREGEEERIEGVEVIKSEELNE